MNRLLFSTLIGIGAGVADVIPMLLMKLERRACLAAFLHWLVLGILICHTTLPGAPWLRGMAIGVAAALPVIVTASASSKKHIVPILVNSLVLGGAVGALSTLWG